MLINLGLKSLARELVGGWFGVKSVKRRSTKRHPSIRGVEVLESRALLTNFLVTTANDDSSTDTGLSLREAIDSANNNTGADTITFSSDLAGQRLLLTQGQLTITDPLTITGLGATDTVIDAQLSSRVFALTQTAGDVTFDGLTVTAGTTVNDLARGAGIYSYSYGTVTLSSCTVTANATFGAGSQGAGIFSFQGPIEMINSTVSGNSTSGDSAPGGGIATNFAPITLVNSTISGNSTTGVNSSGPGIATYGGNIKLTNTTVAFNSATGSFAGGGGIFSGATAAQHTSVIRLNNSIIAKNTTANSTAADFFQGTGVTSLFVNNTLIGINTGSTLAAAPVGSPDSSGNLIGTSASPIDPKLAALAINGGETKTHALTSGSPAVDAGDNSLALDLDNVALTLDQAGQVRILHSIVDMGSFEGVNAASGTPTVSFASATLTVNEGVGTVTLTVNLSSSTSQQVSIPFTLSGTATNSTDFTTTSSPLIIAANSTSGTIQISVTDDTLIESNETIIVTLGTPTNATLGSTTVETVTITDNDSNNSAPTNITLSSNTVTENVANAVVGTLTATDPNAGNTFTFSILSGGQGNQFVISGNQLKVGSTGLDYETLSGGAATVNLRVTDNGGLFFDKTFNIVVTDVNEAPTVAAGQVFTVPEAAANGTAVGTVNASDQDTTAPNKTLTYSITSGNTSNAFAINSSTGLITVATSSALNLATNPSFTLQIKVADGGSPSLSTTQSVTINVGDVNQAPTITVGQVFSTAENRASGAVVGTVVASDLDSTAPNNSLTYSITSGNTGNAFAINSTTGQITINTASAVNFEANSQYTLAIKVTDGGSPALSATGTVRINVTDVNETPVIPAGQVFGVAQNAAANTVVGTVSATDPDTTAPNSTLTYSILSGNTSGAFTINSSTGQITVNNSAALNPATNPQFTLSIQVADGGSPSLSATQNVTVNLSTGNQAPIISAGQVFSTAENRPNGAVIGTVVATDADSSAPNNTLTYSITAGNTNNAFAINASTGQLTINTASAVDFEATSQFILQIKVLDGGSPALSAVGNVTVNVTDVNEAPAIASGQSFAVAQGAAVNTVVGSVSATDPDSAAPNNALTYSIVGGDTSGAFAINASTGEISVSNSAALNPATNPQFTLLVKVADGGSPSLSATQSVTIGYTAGNRAPTISAGQSFTIFDSATNNSPVGTVIASDPDTSSPNNTLTYSIIGGNPNNTFAIDSSNGQITVSNNAGLNSTTTPQYILQIHVADGGTPSLSTTQSVTVNVLAPNGGPTIPANQSFSVTENSPVNTAVGTVVATDPDTTPPNNTLTYSITGGNTNNAFSINSATGLITVSNPSAVNFEANPTFVVQIRVVDGGIPQNSFTQNITIHVIDVNETPVVPFNQVLSVAENAAPNSIVGTVVASDPDSTPPNNTLTYAITGGNTNGAFAINASNGVITVNNSAALAGSSGTFYTLVVRVSDGGSTSLSATQNIRINVVDVNQQPSIPAGQTFTISENPVANTAVGNVVATDADITAPNNTLTYSIIGGNPGGAFSINPTTGQIRVNTPAAINFEAIEQFELQVQVVDGGNPPLNANQIITINVMDVNEAPVIAAGQSFSITDQTANNTVVGTVAASDPDTTAPNNTISYSLVSGNTGGAFSINPNTGVISVVNSAALNAATTPQFTLQVRVTDGGSPALNSTQSVTINVLDANDPPSIPSGQVFTVQENKPLNTVVGTVVATDPDTAAPNRTLTYSITSGNTNNAFTINPSTGQITVNTPAALNFEATSQFTLQVQVSDGGSPSLSASTSVIVNVTDVDEAPALPVGSSYSIAENSSVNTVVGTISATDPDTTAPNSSLTYSIVGGNTGNTFAINPATGQITVASSTTLDFEATPVFTLQIQVTDGGGLSDQQSVTINLTNANDAPVIPAGQILMIAEHAAVNTSVGIVIATDADQTAPNKTLTYSIIGGNTDSAFSINPQTGQILVANSAALSANTSPTFTLQVRAADGGTPSLSATQTVTVNLLDVNEAPAIQAGQVFTLPENPTNGLNVGTVTATDPDPAAPNNALVYSITAGNTGNAFAINSTTGQITINNSGAVNFEVTPQFTLQIQVTDGGTPALSTFGVVTINVTDVNETPSITSGQVFSVVEQTSANTVVGTVSASDPDLSAPNNTLTFGISGGNTNQAFAIDPATGQITVNNSAALIFATNPTFQLAVTALDGSGLSTTQVVTIDLTPLNQAPVLTNTGIPPVYVHRGTDSIAVLPNITVTDPDSATDLRQVIVSLPVPTGRRNRDNFNFAALSALGTVADTTAAGRRQISVTLNAGVTNAAVESALQSMRFSTKGTGLKLTQRDIQVQVVDSQGAASNVITQDITVQRRRSRQS